MIPFPGESLPVDSYENRVGAPIDNLAQIAFRDGAAFFGTGAAAVLRVFFGPNYLESDTDPGEVSWVVEVAGGTGSVTLTECLGDGEPDTLLGTFPVVGGDTLVVPSQVLTLANVWNDYYGSLLIEATVGPLNIQQVKLRAFPTGGALGGWGTDLHPAWERTDYPQAIGAQRSDGQGPATWGPMGAAPITDTWPRSLALLPDRFSGGVDETPVPVSVTNGVDSYASQLSASVDVRVHSVDSALESESDGAAYWAGNGLLFVRGTPYPTVNPAEGLVDGVDYIANPFEVPTDDGALVQADTAPTKAWDDVPAFSWESADGTVGYPLLGALPYAGPLPADGVSVEADTLWPDQAAGLPTDLALPEVDAVLVATSHEWFDGNSPNSGAPDVPAGLTYSGFRVSGWQGHFLAPITYTVAMPPYRVWQVAAAPVHKLRQYNRDDGLGVAPRRAYGGASRNNTGRAYGYT